MFRSLAAVKVLPFRIRFGPADANVCAAPKLMVPPPNWSVPVLAKLMPLLRLRLVFRSSVVPEAML